MDKPALQRLLSEKHGVRVPDDDPVWLIPTLIEAFTERMEAAAVRIEASKAPLSTAEFDKLARRLDARFAHRIVQINRGLVIGSVGALVVAVGLTIGACWWVMSPRQCLSQLDLVPGCYVRPAK